jgi:hypothetical protein
MSDDEVRLSAAAVKRVKAALEDPELLSELKTAAELHAFGHHFNYDGGAEVLLEVVTDSRCDRGTAQRIYWLSEPIEYFFKCKTAKEAMKDYGPEAKNVYKLFDAIEARFAADDFATADIYYDPHDDGGADLAEDWDNPKAARKIPPALAEPTLGRRHSDNLD